MDFDYSQRVSKDYWDKFDDIKWNTTKDIGVEYAKEKESSKEERIGKEGR